MVVCGLYTHFFKDGRYKTTRMRKAWADKAGKYEHFTGIVEWGDSKCTVIDADFMLWLKGYDSFSIYAFSGKWHCDPFDFSEMIGGEMTGGRMTDGEITGGIVSGGTLDCVEINGGTIAEGVIMRDCRDCRGLKMGDPKWHPVEPPETTRAWFDDTDHLARWWGWWRQLR